jgi:peptidoglycan/LPS O-acetylase OafA/YrhL
MHAGWIGVQLFFVLSGFLITGNLLDTQRASNYYGSFIARRALRILPLYYGVLVLTFIVVPALGVTPTRLAETSQHQIWLWTFLTNWFAPGGAAVFGFGHFWSLAIEEQFYLVWPMTIRRLSPRQVLALCGCIAICAFLVRFLMVHTGSSDGAIYMFTYSRMDALACGAAAAAIFRIQEFRRYFAQRVRSFTVATAVMLAIGAAFTRGYFSDDRTCQVYGFSLLAVGFAVFVLAGAVSNASTGWTYRLLTLKPLRLVGKYSYGMYIFHMPLHVFITSLAFRYIVPHPSDDLIFLYIVAVTFISFILAALSYELFEKRFLQLRVMFKPAQPV